MAIPALIDIKDAAAQLGFGVEAVERVAAAKGLLIKCGNRKKVLQSELMELVEHCRVRPKVPASTSESEKAVNPSGSSETKAVSKSRPALNAAKLLTQRSQTTSPTETAPVVHLKQPS